MAKCHPPQNDVGSLILNHSSSPHHHHCRLWNSFSLRKLLATVSCGGAAISKPQKPKNSHHSNTQINKPSPPTNGSSSRAGSGKLADLLNLSSSSCSSERREKVEQNVEDVKKKEERLEELRMAVKLLHSEERENGAKFVRSFAKEDAEARSTLAMLGAIPPLVAMLDNDNDDDDQPLIQALYALLNLGIGNDLNKSAVVQARAVHKMLKKIESSNGCLNSAVSEAIVANFLALSALDSNKPIIGTSGAISYLVSVLEDTEKKASLQARQDSLRALYNLSITPSNIALILETNLIQYLVSMLGDMEMSERILSILSNVVSISEGRRAISNAPDVFPILIDALNWSDSPGCQEKACYVIMVMAHKSYSDRQNMIEAGVGSALLELTLLGSTLAQKRASRILECLRVDKGKQVSRSFVNNKTTAAVSAPICGSSSSTANVNKEEEDMMMSQEKKAVKQLVQLSLQNNMKRIVKRANLPQDFVPSEHLKSLTVSSTSKSLPF
ncbi:U-box domain-containing protein 4-like [Chenopodium quinoa]|uniref:U-box domain-containing protein 4-like n=1 Tax=Chenopodium quinoa TaxID=63459 RepID=UPI000B78999B|nr:U-box domain-containing protein 4-like [Chenopodium quinoa]